MCIRDSHSPHLPRPCRARRTPRASPATCLPRACHVHATCLRRAYDVPTIHGAPPRRAVQTILCMRLNLDPPAAHHRPRPLFYYAISDGILCGLLTPMLMRQ
eukprot:5998184-Prymnesium_polylepis.1